MLHATEDGNDERPASSRREGSSTAFKQDGADRMVYKLVKVGDDGSVLAATEEEVFQSLVGCSGHELSSFDPEGSDAIEDDEDEEDSDYIDSDAEESSGKAQNDFPIEDLAVERQKLRARLEVLDSMLLRVDIEEQRRITTEREATGIVGGFEANSSPLVNACEGTGDYKRQRRPNPKYFDYEAGDDSLSGPPLSSNSGEHIPTPMSSERPPTNAAAISTKVTSGWGSHRSIVRSVPPHTARTAVTHKPLTRALTKVVSSGAFNHGMSNASNEEASLDNLSIRELHEAFCSTYGRETSVKDKHWLKRQISAGWMKQQDVVSKSTYQHPVQNNLKARLDRAPQAEQPLLSLAPVGVGGTERNTGNEANVQRANGVDHSKEVARNKLENKSYQRRVTTPAVVCTGGGSIDISTTGSLNGSGFSGGQIATYGEVINAGEGIGGKRQRKPNRRYIEDEAHVASEFVQVSDMRSFYGDTEGTGLNSVTNYSWRTVETDGPANMIGRHGTVRGSTLRTASSKKFSPIQRPKPMNGGMKRKIGGRAAKLVKMAHSTARAARQDAEASVRKVKFRLAATPDTDTDGQSELNGGARDRSSSFLPIVHFDPSELDRPLPLHRRMEIDQPIATVPTANGGTRRKHHRPWTLREVMTLIEGVARCGGGKWADIKKLAFSTAGYRTAVDLKDKWRNLLRASRAQLHPAKQGERKKQLTAAIPAPILARVRELAALHNRIPSSAVSGSSTSRSGRTVHRK